MPSEDTQLTPKVASSSSSVTSSQKHLTSTKKKSTNPEATTREDCKFNVVIYGIEECTKGISRHTQLNHDFDKIKSIVSEGENSVNSLSIHDFLRLGKFNERSKKHVPSLLNLTEQ